MTDAETFATICADFPFTSEALASLHERLDDLECKTCPGRFGDSSITDKMRGHIRILTTAMRDLKDAMVMVETDGDPEEWIPF